MSEKAEFAKDCMAACGPWSAPEKAIAVFLVWCFALVGWAL